MNTALSVDVVSPRALSAPERDAWRAFVAASPAFRSPYFSLEFALACDGVVPGAAVAVIQRAGEIVGLLPFQKRGGTAQPLGAPLCDYHGVIAAPDEDIDLPTVVKLTGAGGFHFGGLVASEPPRGGRCFVHACMRTDVSGGLDAWLAARPTGRKFFKDKARAWRAAERDLGPLAFQMEDDDPRVIDFIIANKREQFRRTARHDIFACGWTEALLRRLWEERTPGFGCRIATLRGADGRVLAAELGLRAGPVRHIWFPTYDSEFAQWGPGTLLMIAMIKAAAADPDLHEIDFGREGDAYKRFYADPVGLVYEGGVDLDPVRQASSRAADLTLAASPALKQLGEVRERMRRRFEIITACETTPQAWLGGAADAFLNAARRGPASAAGG